MNSIQKDQMTPASFLLSKSSERDVNSTLKAVEVDLFSYQLDASDFELKLLEICGNQFKYEKKQTSDIHTTFYITPEDHCLVEGGMMYKSAGSILADLTSHGFLIKGFRTIESCRSNSRPN